VISAGALLAAAKLAVRRWGTGPAREWPTVSATIDVVSVVEEIREGHYDSVQTTGYTAALTYFYRNPDLQMGEFKRFFQLEFAARLWAEKHKGMNVVVHVNPRDPSDSILLKSDLDRMGSNEEPSLEDALRMERLPRLSGAYLLLAGVSEFVALVGIVLTSAALWLNDRPHTWLTVLVVVMLVFNFVSGWLLSHRLDDSSSYRAILRSHTRFCPTWMRWGVTVTGALLFAFWFSNYFRDLLPQQVQLFLKVSNHYFPYVLAFWGFFTSGATHAAILRSQEQARLTMDGETQSTVQSHS
jgi:hypothetical protein